MTWVWVNTYRYIFSGLFTSMNPSYDLGFTARYQGFDPSPCLVTCLVLERTFHDSTNSLDQAEKKGGHASPETHVLTDLSADVLENVKAESPKCWS